MNFTQLAHHVSPDGRSVAVTVIDSSGSRALWVRRLNSREATRLVGTENGDLPFWSWDSRSIAFFSDDGKLMRVSASGGSPQVICDAPSGRGGTWNQDDVIVFAASAGGPLFSVSSNGGAVTQVTALDSSRSEEAHRWPQFLPDGKHFLYASLPTGPDGFDTYLGSLESDIRKYVVTAGGSAVYAEPGYLIFARDQSLVAQPFDTKRLALTGTAKLTGESPGAVGAWTGSPHVSASRTGVLAHTQGGFRRNELVWFDRSGRQQATIPLEEAFYGQAAISNDERFVAVTRWNVGTGRVDGDLWIVELARGMATRFTFVAADNYEPVWAPDGEHIVFTSDRGGNENLYIKSSDGVGDEEPLLESPQLFVAAHDWSPDGKYIVYHGLVKETGFDLWLLPMAGDRKPIPFLVTQFNETDAAISPDGKWIAYRSDESGTWECYVQSFPEGGNKYRVSTAGSGTYGSGFLTGWSGDGKKLMFPGGGLGDLMVVDVTNEPRFETGVPQRLFRVPIGIAFGTIAPSGERLLFSVTPDGAAQSALSIVTNWSAALEGR